VQPEILLEIKALSYLFTTVMAKYVSETRMEMTYIRLKAKREATMHFDGAVIREQGITFAIVVVKPQVLNSTASCDDARSDFRSFFPGIPIILMAQDGRGTPTYQGRHDIVRFLSNVPPSWIPWKRYNYN
jgi:hypothetical protein